MAETI